MEFVFDQRKMGHNKLAVCKHKPLCHVNATLIVLRYLYKTNGYIYFTINNTSQHIELY